MVDAIFAAFGGFMGGVVFTAFAFIGSNGDYALCDTIIRDTSRRLSA